jgi:hypothetical protein
MKKKILISEEQLKYIINFIKNDETIVEQETNSNVTRIGDVRGSFGKAGISKSEFEAQEDAKKKENQAKIESEGIAEVFAKKMISDIGKQTAFKKLPSRLKEDMMNAWFNEGGVPDDFYKNIDEYSFKIRPLSGRYPISASFAGKEGIKKIKTLDNLYKELNLENFNNYNGSNNSYKIFKTKPGGGNPIFKGESPEIEDINVKGSKLLIIAPSLGDDAATIKQTEAPSSKETIISTPPIPLNYQVESSDLLPNEVKKMNDTLLNFLTTNQEIKNAVSKGISYKIKDIKVISSASNTWAGKTLPFTHNNQGEKVNDSYDNKVQNATKNMNLAKNRGVALSNLLKNDADLASKLQITPETTFQVESIVTDTNGRTDEDNKKNNSGLNPGQFAKFIFTIEYTEYFPGSESGAIKLKYWILEIVKEKSQRTFKNLFSANFAKAKYLNPGGKWKSSREISKNVGKPFRGLGSWLDGILP